MSRKAKFIIDDEKVDENSAIDPPMHSSPNVASRSNERQLSSASPHISPEQSASMVSNLLEIEDSDNDTDAVSSLTNLSTIMICASLCRCFDNVGALFIDWNEFQISSLQKFCLEVIQGNLCVCNFFISLADRPISTILLWLRWWQHFSITFGITVAILTPAFFSDVFQKHLTLNHISEIIIQSNDVFDCEASIYLCGSKRRETLSTTWTSPSEFSLDPNAVINLGIRPARVFEHVTCTALSELVRKRFRHFQSQLDAKKVVVEVDISDPIIPVNMDWSDYSGYDPSDNIWGSVLNPFLERRTTFDLTPGKITRCSVHEFESFIESLGPDGKFIPPFKNESHPCLICNSFFHREKRCPRRMYSKKEAPTTCPFEKALLRFISQLETCTLPSHDGIVHDDQLSRERARLTSKISEFWRRFEAFSGLQRKKLLRGTFSLLYQAVAEWWAIGSPPSLLSKLITGFRIDLQSSTEGCVIIEGLPKSESDKKRMRDWRDKNVPDGKLIRVPFDLEAQVCFPKWIHNIYLLEQKTKTSLIVNGRALNCIEQYTDTFSLPRVDDLFDRYGLPRGALLLSLDMKSAYFQASLTPESMRYACISIEETDGSFSTYAFESLFFGLCSAPSKFMTILFYQILRYLRWLFGFAELYIDDLIIQVGVVGLSRESATFRSNFVRDLFDLLRVRLSADKCVWSPSTLTDWLGKCINTLTENILPTYTKVDAMCDLIEQFFQRRFVSLRELARLRSKFFFITGPEGVPFMRKVDRICALVLKKFNLDPSLDLISVLWDIPLYISSLLKPILIEWLIQLFTRNFDRIDSDTDLFLITDASPEGAGGYLESNGNILASTQVLFPSIHTSTSSTSDERLGLYLISRNFHNDGTFSRHLTSACCITTVHDSTSLISQLRSHKSESILGDIVLKKIHKLFAAYGCTTRHLWSRRSTLPLVIADSKSRRIPTIIYTDHFWNWFVDSFDFDKFKICCPLTKPEDYITLTKYTSHHHVAFERAKKDKLHIFLSPPHLRSVILTTIDFFLRKKISGFLVLPVWHSINWAPLLQKHLLQTCDFQFHPPFIIHNTSLQTSRARVYWLSFPHSL